MSIYTDYFVVYEPQAIKILSRSWTQYFKIYFPKITFFKIISLLGT